MPALKPLVFRWQLLDTPGERKQHGHPIALVGGIAMFVSFAIEMSWLSGTSVQVLVLMRCALLLVVTGVIDDRVELPTRVRFLSQITAGALMYAAADVRLVGMGWLRLDGGSRIWACGRYLSLCSVWWARSMPSICWMDWPAVWDLSLAAHSLTAR